jgi:hypothetical protein
MARRTPRYSGPERDPALRLSVAGDIRGLAASSTQRKEKVRIVIAGLRGEHSVAELCNSVPTFSRSP